MNIAVNKFPRLTLAFSLEGSLPAQGTEIFFDISINSGGYKIPAQLVSTRWFLISSTKKIRENLMIATFSCHIGAFSKVTNIAVNNLEIESIVKRFFDNSYHTDICKKIPALNTFVSYSDTLESLFVRIAKFTNSFFLIVPLKYQDVNGIDNWTWSIKWKKNILGLKGEDYIENINIHNYKNSFEGDINPDLNYNNLTYAASSPIEINNILIESDYVNAEFPKNFSEDLFSSTDAIFSDCISYPINFTSDKQSNIFSSLMNAYGVDLTLNFHAITAHFFDYNLLHELFDFSFLNDFSKDHNELTEPYFQVSLLIIYSGNSLSMNKLRESSSIFRTNLANSASVSSFAFIQHTLPISLLGINEKVFQQTMDRLRVEDIYQSALLKLGLLIDYYSQSHRNFNDIRYPILHTITHNHLNPSSLGPVKLDSKGFYTTRIAVKIIGD
jgi:hypothetical protein